MRKYLNNKVATIRKRFFLSYVIFVFILLFLSCQKKVEIVEVSVCPEDLKANLYFRGYVTDNEEELVSQIYDFSRKVVRKDTVDGKPVFVFESNGKDNYYFRDEEGTVWQKISENLSDRVVTYGYSFKKPFVLNSWNILLKQTEGEGTNWSEFVDTTFTVLTLKGKPQKIRYIHVGKAKNNGWQNVFIPQTYRYEKAIDAYWYKLSTLILNETTGDTLFVNRGTAHQYFIEKLGAVKYITDFIKREKDKPQVRLHGTWELVRIVQ